MIAKPDSVCPIHPEVSKTVENLSSEVKTKVSFAHLAWGIGISIIILVAVFGVLWSRTVAFENRLALAEEKLIVRIEKTDQMNDMVVSQLNSKIDNLLILTTTLATELRMHIKDNPPGKGKGKE